MLGITVGRQLTCSGAVIGHIWHLSALECLEIMKLESPGCWGGVDRSVRFPQRLISSYVLSGKGQRLSHTLWTINPILRRRWVGGGFEPGLSLFKIYLFFKIIFAVLDPEPHAGPASALPLSYTPNPNPVIGGLN